MTLPAHAVQKWASPKGFVAAGDDLAAQAPRLEALLHQCGALRQRTIRPKHGKTARECQDEALPHLTSLLP